MEELWLVNFCLSSMNWYWSMEELWLINFCGSSQSWYWRMEDLFLGTEGWNYGSIVIYRESPMDCWSNICFAKFIVPEFKELVQMDGRIIPWYRRLEEWFHRERESPNCSEEVIFGWLKGWKPDYLQRNPSELLFGVIFGTCHMLMYRPVNVSWGMNINLGLHVLRNLCDAIFQWCGWLGTFVSR